MFVRDVILNQEIVKGGVSSPLVSKGSCVD